MTEIRPHPENRTAEVQPAAYSGDLNVALQPHGLMFPGGHCPTVRFGGLLLEGGFGINSRVWGVACQSIIGFEMVNSDGELIYVDATQYLDLFWAARGSREGFFGVVTRFYLTVHSRPRVMMTGHYVFPYRCLDELLLFIESIQDKFPPILEVTMFISRDQEGIAGPRVILYGVCWTETEQEAQNALQLLDSLPITKAAFKSDPYRKCEVADILKRFQDVLDSRGKRYDVDNLWTDTPMRQLLRGLHGIVDDLPAAPSHLAYNGGCRTNSCQIWHFPYATKCSSH